MLWWIMLAGAVVIVTFVGALLWQAFNHSSVKNRHADLAQDVSSTRVWIMGLGLVFPAIVLGLLFVYALIVGERLLPHPSDNVVTVEARAQQWRWSFAYQDRPDLITDGVLHIPAGQPVDVAITTSDVIHSFWVPQLAGKLDAIPGHVNVLRIEADVPGTYAGRSAEFSGAGYTDHIFEVRAHGPAEWTALMQGGTP